MKRILLLTAVLMLATATGCRSQSWFNRGAPCNTCGPTAGDAYMAAPAAVGGMPANAQYLPAPG